MKKLVVTFPVLAGIMWGAVGVFTRTLGGYGMNSFTILEIRMLLGVVILFAGCMLVDRSLLRVRLKDAGIFLAGGLLGNFGLSYFYVEAINRLSMAFAAVLLCTFPFFVMLLSAVLFHEKITWRKIGCLVLAFAGCVLVSGILEKGNLTGAAANWTALGVLIGVIAAFCYALYSIFSKMARDRGYSPITITFYFMLLVLLVLIPLTEWNLLSGFIREAPVTNGLFLVGHSLVTAVVPYVIYTYSMSFMDAGKASILASAEPVAAMVFGALLFSEMPSLLMVGGMLLTVAAIAILSLPEKRAD